MAEQTLTILTKASGLRSEAIGWNCEDSSLYVPNKAIGLTPGPRPHGHWTYDTVLQAQADGWKLLAPPRYSEDEEGWDWWLTRESEE